MKQRQIISRFLFPSRQYAAKAIHPAMRPLYHPAASLESSLMFNRLCFFATRTNMSRIAKLFGQVSYLTRIITFIKAHTLFFPLRRLRSFYRNTFYRRPGHFAIMAIRTINRQANRHPRTFRQQTPFNAFFGPVRRVWAGFFPHRAGLWSWHHPSIARTSQSLSIHRSLPRPSSRVSGIHPLGSILEIASGRYCWNKYQFRSTHSIDNRFARRKISRPWLCDPARGAARRQNDGYSYALATTALFFAIIHLKSYTYSLFFAFSSLNPFKSILAFVYIGNSGVIRIGP